MPLQDTTFDTLKADIKAAPSETYVVFTGAKDESGKSWCGSCNEAAPDIERIFKGDEHHALVVPFTFDDFDNNPWPRKEWAIRGVPMIYRLKDGELSGAFLIHNDQPFGEMLEAYVSGDDAYEKWTEEKRGDNYIPPETRWKWLREDFDVGEKRAQEDLARGQERAKWREEYLAKRKAAQNGSDTAEKKARTDAEVPADEATFCTGAACVA